DFQDYIHARLVVSIISGDKLDFVGTFRAFPGPMSRSRSFFVSTLSATALLTPLLAVLLPASSLAVPTNSIAAPPRIENWVESRIRTLLLGDEKNASRNREIYLRHLEDGITIAESDFPADQRASLMMDWIERSFSARNLGWDPLSLL